METEIAQFQCACFSNKCSNNIFGPGLFQLLIVDVSTEILRGLHYNDTTILGDACEYVEVDSLLL